MTRFSIYSNEARLSQALDDVHDQLTLGASIAQMPDELRNKYQEKEIAKLMNCIYLLLNPKRHATKIQYLVISLWISSVLKILGLFLIFQGDGGIYHYEKIVVIISLLINIIALYLIHIKTSHAYILSAVAGVFGTHQLDMILLESLKSVSPILSTTFPVASFFFSIILIILGWRLNRIFPIEIEQIKMMLRKKNLDFSDLYL